MLDKADGWTSECPTEEGQYEFRHAGKQEPTIGNFSVSGARQFHRKFDNPQWRPHKLAGSIGIPTELPTPETDYIISKLEDSEPLDIYEKNGMLEMTEHARQLETRLAEAERRVVAANRRASEIDARLSAKCAILDEAEHQLEKLKKMGEKPA